MSVLSLYGGWNPSQLLVDLLRSQLRRDVESLSRELKELKEPEVEEILEIEEFHIGTSGEPFPAFPETSLDGFTQLAQKAAEALELHREICEGEIEKLVQNIKEATRILVCLEDRDMESVKQFLRNEIAENEEMLWGQRIALRSVLKRTRKNRETLATGRIDILKLLLQIFDAYYPTQPTPST